MLNDVEPLVLISLQKGLAKNIGEAKVDVGTHPVDSTFSVRVQGTLERLNDSCRMVAPKISLPLLLALICRKAKVSRKDLAGIVSHCLDQAIAGESVGGVGGKDYFRDCEEAFEAAIAGARVEQKAAGATSFKGVVTVE